MANIKKHIKIGNKFMKVGGKILTYIPHGLIYETNFTNFDMNTGIDTPLIGNHLHWTKAEQYKKKLES